MKKVPFDYEYFKSNPDTQLVCRDENIKPPIFLVEKKIKGEDGYDLLFQNSDGAIVAYTSNGLYYKNTEHRNDLFMLVPSKEEVLYVNEYNEGFGYYNKSIEDCKKLADEYSLRIVKFIKVDGLIDYSRTEIVHIYNK